MTTIQACQSVLTDGCKLLRVREVKPIPQYDVKDAFTGKKRGWFYLDSFTASAIMAVYNALNDDNKEKCLKLRVDTFAAFAFKHVR